MISSRYQMIPSDNSVDIFPFLSLPTEIRIMIYDAALPEEVHHIDGRCSGILPWIRAFMRIKAVRTEFLSHFFSRSHFIWHDVALNISGANDRRDPFKRYAVPFIATLTILLQSTPSASKSNSPPDPEGFDALLRWMRWRSVRSHIHPWHLKHLTLVAPHFLPPHQPYWLGMTSKSATESFNCLFSPLLHPILLTRACNVSGLYSLDIILPSYPELEPAKKFFGRCASNGLVGMIGYQEQPVGKVIWLCLENNQIVPLDH